MITDNCDWGNSLLVIGQRQEFRTTHRLLIGFAALWLSGCSVNRFAVNILGDALADGGSVYAIDNDPQLIREALPFGLKTFESLLQISPDHEGLLLAASRGFTAYAFILQHETECDDNLDSEQRRKRLVRIRHLFLRGHDYALAGLAARHDSFVTQLRGNPHDAIEATGQADTPFLYWAGAALGGAISSSQSDLNLLADLPLAGALVQRVLELDESYDHGAAHEFFIAYEANRPGGSTERARKHYRRALELSSGRRASVHLALAEAVAIKEQNLAEFRRLLADVMAVNPEKHLEFRLVNELARQRALWLEKHTEEFFIDTSSLKEKVR